MIRKTLLTAVLAAAAAPVAALAGEHSSEWLTIGETKVTTVGMAFGSESAQSCVNKSINPLVAAIRSDTVKIVPLPRDDKRIVVALKVPHMRLVASPNSRSDFFMSLGEGAAGDVIRRNGITYELVQPPVQPSPTMIRGCAATKVASR